MKTIVLIVVLLSFTNGCPREEDLYPCTCEWPNSRDSAYITCSGLVNDQELVKAASSLVGKNYVYLFSIKNSVFNFIPSDAFKGLKFVELEITNSSLMALTDTDIAFEGLENTLEILTMTESTFMNEWDWFILRNLNKLMRLDIDQGDLENIEDLGKINMTNLKDISIVKNRISFIHPDAFANCKNLMVLSLGHNYISEMVRSMLPNPALELQDIDLSYNEIEELPENLFINMPSLKHLSIGHNKILVLSEKVFLPVWSGLESFEAMGNDLRCDCRIIWILSRSLPETVRATCSQPSDLRGKSIASLTSKNLWCYK